MSQNRLLAYKKEEFVNRDDEVKSVLDKLSALVDGKAPETRTVAFRGERGVGKTWLLEKIREQIDEEYSNEEVLVFWLDLDQYREKGPIWSVIDALKQLADLALPTSEMLGATPADISRRVMEAVRAALEEKRLVIFADHVYEADWELLAGLEDYVLGPLAIEERTLILLAGRGRAYPWKTPELRINADFVDLKPLSREDTRDQLKRQVSTEAAQRVGRIYRTSGGNPMANYLLGSHKEEENSIEALRAVVDELMAIVPQGQRKEVQTYLEALSVLNVFDEERIPKLMAAYHDDPTYANWSFTKARKVREMLVRYSFAYWSEAKAGFVLYNLIRVVFKRYLKRVDPARWQRLEQAALELYDEWWDKYQRGREFWEEEIRTHAAALKSAHVDPKIFIKNIPLNKLSISV